jgi:hypothetical protein
VETTSCTGARGRLPASPRALWLVLGLSISLGCDNGEQPAGAPRATAMASTDAAEATDAGPATAAAGALPPSAAGVASSASSIPPSTPPAASLEAVDANGVKGALVAREFLSDNGDGRLQFIAVDWQIPADSEQYLCGRLTVPKDVYMSAFYPINPFGTHHTALTVLDAPNAPDGVTECDISEVGTSNLGGSGPGTMGGTLPDGVAMKFARGSQILLNLHLFNTGAAPISGRSGAEIQVTEPNQVKTLADGVAIGPLKLTVPPGRSVQSGVCTVDHDFTIFSIMPHMHQTGTHMKVVARRAAGDLVIQDGPFDFYNQRAQRLDPLDMKTGDTISIECTYENTSERTLHFGESSNDEMCIAGLARYPAGGKSACPY